MAASPLIYPTSHPKPRVKNIRRFINARSSFAGGDSTPGRNPSGSCITMISSRGSEVHYRFRAAAMGQRSLLPASNPTSRCLLSWRRTLCMFSFGCCHFHAKVAVRPPVSHTKNENYSIFKNNIHYVQQLHTNCGSCFVAPAS